MSRAQVRELLVRSPVRTGKEVLQTCRQSADAVKTSRAEYKTAQHVPLPSPIHEGRGLVGLGGRAFLEATPSAARALALAFRLSRLAPPQGLSLLIERQRRLLLRH